jgi:hypothetical protein
MPISLFLHMRRRVKEIQATYSVEIFNLSSTVTNLSV